MSITSVAAFHPESGGKTGPADDDDEGKASARRSDGTMGNQLVGIAPSQIFPVEHYLTDHSDLRFDVR